MGHVFSEPSFMHVSLWFWRFLASFKKIPFFSYLKLITGFRSRESNCSLLESVMNSQSTGLQIFLHYSKEKKNADHVIMELSGTVLPVFVILWQQSNIACNPLSAPLTNSEVSQTAWVAHISLGNSTAIMWHPLKVLSVSELPTRTFNCSFLLFLHIQRSA